MKVKIISIGKVKQDFVLSGEREYCTRLKPHFDLSFLELESRAELPEAVMKREEARAVEAKISDQDVLVVLDERGKSMSSRELSQWFQEQLNQGRSSFCFAIGGAYGWDESIPKKAKLALSLSRLTFTYQMSRLILVEQLYRAVTLLKGIPYHK